MATIYLFRTGNIVKHNGATGEMSVMVVEGAVYWAVERRDSNYMTLDPGEYVVKMELSPTHQGRKQFRVKEHNKHTFAGSVAAILIHTANYPHELAGCIAPGLTTIDGGVGQSHAAMTKIFSAFGGFHEGGTGDLVIDYLN